MPWCRPSARDFFRATTTNTAIGGTSRRPATKQCKNQITKHNIEGTWTIQTAMCKLTGEVILCSKHDRTEWLVGNIHTIDGNRAQHRHIPGKDPDARVRFKQSCIQNMCQILDSSAMRRSMDTGITPYIVFGGDTNLGRSDLMGWIGDQSGLPGGIFVLGTKRDFLTSTLQLEPLAAQLPTAHDNMHTAVGAKAMARQALAATQGQGQAASSSSAAPVQEPARTREWAEQRAKELAARLLERCRREKAARLAAEAAEKAKAEAEAAQAEAEAPVEAAAAATEEELEWACDLTDRVCA